MIDRNLIFVFSWMVLLVTPAVSGAQNSTNDSLKLKLDKLEKQLDQERSEREKLRREVELQKRAAEKYRQDYEESSKSQRRRRQERRNNDLEAFQNGVFKGDRDSLKRDETVSFFEGGRSRVFQGFEIGVSGFSYNDYFSFNSPAGQRGYELDNATSIHWAINPFEMDVRIIGEYFKFSTGLGYSVKNFSFANNNLLRVSNGPVVSSEVDIEAWDFSRNRFRTGYINLPLLFHLNTRSRPSKSVGFVFGAVTGLRLFEIYRVKYFEAGQRVDYNISRNWKTNRFNLEARAGITYGGIQLFATHFVNPLFTKNVGPDLFPFTIGLSFNPSFDG